MPKQYQNNVPNPKDTDVMLEKSPTLKLYVRPFTGCLSHKTVREQVEHMWTTLRLAGRDQFESDAIAIAAYDAPFRLRMHYNEIWIGDLATTESPGSNSADVSRRLWHPAHVAHHEILQDFDSTLGGNPDPEGTDDDDFFDKLF